MKTAPATLYTLLAKTKVETKVETQLRRERNLVNCETVQQNEELIKNFKVTASLSYVCETWLFPSRELRAIGAKQPLQGTLVGYAQVLHEK